MRVGDYPITMNKIKLMKSVTCLEDSLFDKLALHEQIKKDVFQIGKFN